MPRQRFGGLARRCTTTPLSLYYPSGPTCHLWMSSTVPAPGPRFRLWGGHGLFEKAGLDVQEAALADGGVPGSDGWGMEPEEGWGALTVRAGAGITTIRVPTLPGAYQEYYAGVVAAIRDGSAPPVTGEEGHLLTRIIEAAMVSAQRRCAVDIDPGPAVSAIGTEEA